MASLAEETAAASAAPLVETQLETPSPAPPVIDDGMLAAASKRIDALMVAVAELAAMIHCMQVEVGMRVGGGKDGLALRQSNWTMHETVKQNVLAELRGGE